MREHVEVFMLNIELRKGMVSAAPISKQRLKWSDNRIFIIREMRSLGHKKDQPPKLGPKIKMIFDELFK